jgi:hypothetical protein
MSIVNWHIHMKINAVVIRGVVSERHTQKLHHPDFRQIKIVGENFWPSKYSG